MNDAINFLSLILYGAVGQRNFSAVKAELVACQKAENQAGAIKTLLFVCVTRIKQTKVIVKRQNLRTS